MRLFPVMGTALINAHHLTTRAKGDLLIPDAIMASGLSGTAVVSAEFPDFVVIDWIHADTPDIRQITGTSIASDQTGVLEQRLRQVLRLPRLGLRRLGQEHPSLQCL